MKLLLDTHIFISWADHPEKLSQAALAALEDEANECSADWPSYKDT
ncbi:MAG: hypothetical protein HW419_1886 [Deltaproteobacteria bacterium]|nr:hypothetical protein [Deltaproteobacteria bacterium]